MNVSDLIEVLSKADPTALVVMSSDEEGNSYKPLHSINMSEYVYVSDGWEGSIKLHTLTPELEAVGYGDEDVWDEEWDEEAPRCVVLWP